MVNSRLVTLPVKKIVLGCYYFMYLHQTHTTVFAIASAIKPTKFNLSSAIIWKHRLFVNVSHSVAGQYRLYGGQTVRTSHPGIHHVMMT